MKLSIEEKLRQANIVCQRLDKCFDEFAEQKLDDECVLVGFAERTATVAASMLDMDDAAAVAARDRISRAIVSGLMHIMAGERAKYRAGRN